jgi:hypothetical protein
MQLAYVRALAVDAAGPGERVQDVVLTVPAFFSQLGRNVNYTMMRQFLQRERQMQHSSRSMASGSTAICARSLPRSPSINTA